MKLSGFFWVVKTQLNVHRDSDVSQTHLFFVKQIKSTFVVLFENYVYFLQIDIDIDLYIYTE